jgi:Fe2+ transport system protein FeoA
VGINLATAPLGTPLTLTHAGDDQSVAHRLARLGLRVGVSFSLISRTAGGGRVAVVAGTRIALGKPILHQLQAKVIA